MGGIDLERVRQKAIEIAKLAEGMKPNEFAAALGIAIGAIIPVSFPREAWPAALDGIVDGACKVIRDTVEKRGLPS